MAELVSEILAQMNQPNGYAQDGTTNTAAGQLGSYPERGVRKFCA